MIAISDVEEFGSGIHHTPGRQRERSMMARHST
jgi:hypothetical protein